MGFSKTVTMFHILVDDNKQLLHCQKLSNAFFVNLIGR